MFQGHVLVDRRTVPSLNSVPSVPCKSPAMSSMVVGTSVVVVGMSVVVVGTSVVVVFTSGISSQVPFL